jgi:hypothetical protein
MYVFLLLVSQSLIEWSVRMLSRRDGPVKMSLEHTTLHWLFKAHYNDGQTLTHFRDGYIFALGHGQRLQFPTDKQSREKRSELVKSSQERYGVCLIGPSSVQNTSPDLKRLSAVR